MVNSNLFSLNIVRVCYKTILVVLLTASVNLLNSSLAKIQFKKLHDKIFRFGYFTIKISFSNANDIKTIYSFLTGI